MTRRGGGDALTSTHHIVKRLNGQGVEMGMKVALNSHGLAALHAPEDIAGSMPTALTQKIRRLA